MRRRYLGGFEISCKKLFLSSLFLSSSIHLTAIHKDFQKNLFLLSLLDIL